MARRLEAGTLGQVGSQCNPTGGSSAILLFLGPCGPGSVASGTTSCKHINFKGCSRACAAWWHWCCTFWYHWHAFFFSVKPHLHFPVLTSLVCRIPISLYPRILDIPFHGHGSCSGRHWSRVHHNYLHHSPCSTARKGCHPEDFCYRIREAWYWRQCGCGVGES